MHKTPQKTHEGMKQNIHTVYNEVNYTRLSGSFQDIQNVMFAADDGDGGVTARRPSGMILLDT